MTIKELQERKNQCDKAVRDMADKFAEQGNQWSDEAQRSAWTAVNEDFNKANSELRAAQEIEDVKKRRDELDAIASESQSRGSIPGREDRSYRQPDVGSDDGSEAFTEEDYALALNGWCRGAKHATDAEKAAMKRCGISINANEICVDPREHAESVKTRKYVGKNVEKRANMSTTVGSTGGYSIEASSLVRNLEINMVAFGGMRQVAETITTSTGEPLLWPTFDDTSNTAAILAENTSIGTSVEPTLAQVTWNAYKFSSKPILVPQELIQDSFVDLNTVLGNALGERIGRYTNTLYTTGTGSSQPKGIITAASSGVSAASATAITFGELMALVHSVDPAYRTGGGFMMHDNVLLYIRQLKDSQNRPLYVSGLVEGMPDRLLGFPVTINQSMASSVATTNKTVLFGQLSKYKIRRVGGPRLYRLEERYRDYDQTGFVAFVREDGNLLTSTTVPCKYITQA